MTQPVAPQNGRSGAGKLDTTKPDPIAVRIPILDSVEQTLARGDFRTAVATAYLRVVLDIQAAYGLSLPRQWTHREFLTRFLRGDMGPLPTLVAQLYALYEPARYGTRMQWVQGDLRGLLGRIYSEPSLRGLYEPPSSGLRTSTGPAAYRHETQYPSPAGDSKPSVPPPG
jgi:hypothetical protein